MLTIQLLLQNLMYDISQLALPWEYFPWLAGTLLAYCCVAQGMKTFYIRRFKQGF
jgi:hypothetical protein